MSEQIIKLSESAAKRIKEILASADKDIVGVRVGVKSGGCAGMSYIMEYAKDIKPNEEVVEEKGAVSKLVEINPEILCGAIEIYIRSSHTVHSHGLQLYFEQ